MQGQMRTCFPATVICLGMWCGSVPLAYVAITFHLDEKLGIGPLVTLWACCCLGEGISCLMMAFAVWRSNWHAISAEAIANADLGEEDHTDTDEEAEAVAAAGEGQVTPGRPWAQSEPEWWSSPAREEGSGGKLV